MNTDQDTWNVGDVVREEMYNPFLQRTSYALQTRTIASVRKDGQITITGMDGRFKPDSKGYLVACKSGNAWSARARFVRDGEKVRAAMERDRILADNRLRMNQLATVCRRHEDDIAAITDKDLARCVQATLDAFQRLNRDDDSDKS